MSFHGETRLVPDSVYGCRRWSVHADGSLWSFSAGYKWLPGWQTATCHGSPHHLSRPHGRYCSCGFWAYWNQFGEHVRDTDGANNVGGIIEGKGSAVVGDSGFRIAEARIVALVIPSVPKPRLSKQWLTWFLPIWGTAWVVYYLALGIYSAIGHQSGLAALYGGFTLAFVGMAWWGISRLPMSIRQKILKKYPEVKIYRSWDAAFKDYPVEMPPWRQR